MIKKIFFTLMFCGLLELIVLYQQSKIILILLSILLFFLSLISTFKFKFFFKQGFLGQLNISFLPIAYTLGVTLFLIFIPEIFYLQHIYIALCAVIFFLIINFLSKIIKNPDNRKKLKSSDFIITISAFLLYSSVFGLYLFLKWPIWLLMLLLILITFVLTYEFFWYNQLFKKHIIYSLILTLVISEIAWALTLWPTGYISRAIVIFTIFYVFTNLSKHNFNKTLNKKVVRNILFIGAIVLLLGLLTTKWTF